MDGYLIIIRSPSDVIHVLLTRTSKSFDCHLNVAKITSVPSKHVYEPEPTTM